MRDMLTANRIIATADFAGTGQERWLRAAVESGVLTRIRRGYYTDTDGWVAAGARERHLLRVETTELATKGETVVFSHQSAAAIWNLPQIGELPTKVHVGVRDEWRGRSRAEVHEHVLTPGTPTAVVDDHEVIAVADTVVLCVPSMTFAHAVALADGAIHVSRDGSSICTQNQLFGAYKRHEYRRGIRSGFRAIQFADTRADSPGESISRANMSLSRLEAPELQVPFYDRDGLIGIVDFYWPVAGLIGEFDGLGKYLREEYIHGRTTGEVVVAEKMREDRLRALGPSVTRWGWELANSPRELAGQLMRAGVRRLR
jgi:hypothetical protein